MATRVATNTSTPTMEALPQEPQQPTGGPRPKFSTILEQNKEPVFRPNGSVGIHQLHDWSGLDVGGHALELASKVGRTSGMNMAHRFGCHVTLTNSDPSHFAMAHTFAKEEGLAPEQWETKLLEDMIHVGSAFSLEKQFDCAIVEQAALSRRSNADKRIIVKGLAQHTQQVLLHEFCLSPETNEAVANNVQADLSHALEEPVHLMSVESWKQLLQDAGLQALQIETGPVRLWDPKRQLLREEQGLSQMVHAAWNMATHEELRSRVLEMHEIVEAHKDKLGYVLIQAVRVDPNNPKALPKPIEKHLFPPKKNLKDWVV